MNALCSTPPDARLFCMLGFVLLSQDRSADLAVGKEIRVSPYRLAAHLATAFATFSLLVHTGFQVRTATCLCFFCTTSG